MLAPCLPTTVLIVPSEPGWFSVVTLSRAGDLGQRSRGRSSRDRAGDARQLSVAAEDGHSARWMLDRPAGADQADDRRRRAPDGSSRQLERDARRQADDRRAGRGLAGAAAAAAGSTRASSSPLRGSWRLSSGWSASSTVRGADARRRRPRPADPRRDFWCSGSSTRSSCLSVTLSCSWRAGLARSSRPCARCSSRWRSRRWRRIRARALPVTTKRSHPGDGGPFLLVMISTWSPFCSWARSWTMRPSILAPTQRSPTCGMDGVGEVDRRGAARQGDQVALGREAEHLVLEHLELGVLEEILGPGRVLEDVQQLADPAILLALGDPGALLVGPVRRHAELGQLVHVAGADLHLDLAPLRPDDRGVQRAVAVGLGRADEVLEAPGQHVVGAVDDAQGRVAGRHAVDDARGTP